MNRELAFQVGNPARYGKVRKLDDLGCWDGRIRVQAGRLTRGSPVSSGEPVTPNKRRRKEGSTWCRVADESVVVMNPRPMMAGNGPEEKTEGTAVKVPLGRVGQKSDRLRRDESKPKRVTKQ